MSVIKMATKAERIKKMLEPLFDESEHQEDVVVGVYRKFVPNYDDVEQIQGHPKCGKEMSLWLFEKFIEFDKKHHPDVMAGGAWLNWGFSTDEKLGWEVSLGACTMAYKKGVQRNRG